MTIITPIFFCYPCASITTIVVLVFWKRLLTGWFNHNFKPLLKFVTEDPSLVDTYTSDADYTDTDYTNTDFTDNDDTDTDNPDTDDINNDTTE